MTFSPHSIISPIRVTLDTNSIIDLEEDRQAAPALRELIALHRDGSITLCVSNIAAGERSRNRRDEPDFARFKAKLARAGLADVELLLPTMHWGITFWDQAVWGELGDALKENVLEILFPGKKIRGDYPGETDAQRLGKDLNPLCDAITMWCHIHYHGDIFVSRDERFHQLTKKPRLIELGARHILRPNEVITFLRPGSGVNG
jgi:hypothetical protein